MSRVAFALAADLGNFWYLAPALTAGPLVAWALAVALAGRGTRGKPAGVSS